MGAWGLVLGFVSLGLVCAAVGQVSTGLRAKALEEVGPPRSRWRNPVGGEDERERVNRELIELLNELRVACRAYSEAVGAFL